MELSRILYGLTGLIIVGESLLLFIGLGLMGDSNTWVGVKNNCLIVLDIITGFILLFYSYDKSSVSEKVFKIIMMLGVLTHIYRDFEYFSKVLDRFIFNHPLLILNNIRLTGLVYTVLNT
jgi:hypothetical protein